MNYLGNKTCATTTLKRTKKNKLEEKIEKSLVIENFYRKRKRQQTRQEERFRGKQV